MQYLYLDTSEMKHVHWPAHSIEGIRIDLVDGFYQIKILRLVRMYGGMEYIWYQDTSTVSPLYAACLVTCKLHVNNYDQPIIWEHARDAANRYIEWENMIDTANQLFDLCAEEEML